MTFLKTLSLKNFVLIKETSVEFYEGFHAISGETGSGKTMILEALSLILGEKADLLAIRKGEEKAFIEAEFFIEPTSLIHPILQALGISLSSQSLIIGREIGKHKNKVWISDKLCAVSDLKQLAPYLGEIIHSHAQLALQDTNYQKNLLDTYGRLQELVMKHHTLFITQQELIAKKAQLIQLQKEGAIYAKLWEEIIKEIDSLKITSDEKEQELFAKYTVLIDQQGLLELSQKTLSEISESSHSILSRLSKCQKDLHKLSIQPELTGIDSLATQACEQLTDISFKLSSYLESVERSFSPLDILEKELSQAKTIKKKYGPTFLEVAAYKDSLEKKLQEYGDLEDKLSTLDKRLQAVTQERALVAQELTQKRKVAASSLSAAIEYYLPSLNLAKTRIFIELTQAAPCFNGEDHVEFFFQTEGSSDKRSLGLHASSGELARIFFILQLLLQDKKPHKVLIFDEIDANIGGITAGMLGELFEKLGRAQQVIAITHFAQVALHANHHLHIEKISSDQQVSSLITLLDKVTKKKELNRMVGGISLTHLSVD